MINPKIQCGRRRRAKNFVPLRKIVSAYRDLARKCLKNEHFGDQEDDYRTSLRWISGKQLCDGVK
jgi:hypothetical protein